MSTVVTSLAIAGLRKPLEDLYTSALGVVKRKLKTLQSETRVKQIHKSISSVQKIKTMWRIDREVKLLTFYYPSKLVVEKSAKTISSLSEISLTERIVIQGTVGQGKSIFLRYLCIRELGSAGRVPVFLELRRFSPKVSFREFLHQGIAVYGIPCDGDVFEYLADSGKLVLLLDAFDEIDPDSVTNVLTEIELLAQQHPKLQIVITSRPDSGIERSAHFRVYQLAALTPQDHRPFLELITNSAQRATEIQGAIRKSSSDVKSLLQTPLLLTLLVIVYNAREEVPSSLSEFYEALFHTLLMRHDKTKPGFKRKRDSGLSDPELKKIFEAFCYAARQHDLLVLSDSTLSGLLEQASKVTGIACKGDAFSNDITKVACLMQQEGFQYHFIHKSVAEFHAASFISKTSEENAIRFYSAMSARAKWSKWRQELEFLSQLDRHRYLRYFYVPSTLDAFKKLEVGEEVGDVSEDVTKKFLNSLQIVVIPRVADQPGMSFRFMPGSNDQMRGFVLDNILMDTFHDAFNLCKPHPRVHSESRAMPLGDYVSERGHSKGASAIVGNAIKNHRYILKTCKSELDVEKKVAEFVSP